MKFALKHFVGLVLGHLALYYYVFRFGGYVGRQKIYARLQTNADDLVTKSLRYIIDDPMGKTLSGLRTDLSFLTQNINNPRLTSKVIEQYSTDDLMGYGDHDYDKGGQDIYEQQRSLLLPELESFLTQQNQSLTVCELGTGNGDIVAHLAQKFPQHKFIGVDFSISTASQKHKIANLSFVKGYGLALLENKDITPDVFLASSTMCLFTPLELKAYVQTMSSVKHVFINEPSWAGLKMEEGKGVYSEHLEGAVWFHNYPAYFKERGYEAVSLKASSYKHAKSPRPDAWMNVAHFAR